MSTVAASAAPRVCVSILNWNHAAATLDCIRSVASNLRAQDQIVVLDNGSADDSVPQLRQWPGITLLTSPTNLGFAGGHNRVLRHAVQQGFDYVWLLNNDATAQADCLARLVQHAQAHPHCALISPVILDSAAPHAGQHTLSILNVTGTGVVEVLDIEAARQTQAAMPQRVIVWGTALLVRVSALARLGYLDEQLFAYSEDTDYSLRSLRAGFGNAVVLDAIVRHEHPPHPRKPHYYYYTQRNSSLMWRKYTTGWTFLKLMRWNLHLAHKQLGMLVGHPEAATALKLGIWHGLLRRGGAYDRDQRLSRPARWLVNLALAVA